MSVSGSSEGGSEYGGGFNLPNANGDQNQSNNAFFGSYGYGGYSNFEMESFPGAAPATFTWGNGEGMEIDISNGLQYDEIPASTSSNTNANPSPAPMGPLAMIAQNLSSLNVSQKDGASKSPSPNPHGPTRGHARAESTQFPSSVAGAERFAFTGMNPGANGGGLANFVLPVGRRACSAPRAASAASNRNGDAQGEREDASGIKIPTLLPVGLGSSEVSFE